MSLRGEVIPDFGIKVAEVLPKSPKVFVEGPAHSIGCRGALLVVADNDDPWCQPQKKEMFQPNLTRLIDNDHIEGVASNGQIL